MRELTAGSEAEDEEREAGHGRVVETSIFSTAIEWLSRNKDKTEEREESKEKGERKKYEKDENDKKEKKTKTSKTELDRAVQARFTGYTTLFLISFILSP